VDESQRQLIALLAQGSIAGALIYIIIKVGNALVAKVAALATELADHTRRDLAEQAATRAWLSSAIESLRDRVIAFDARFDSLLDLLELTPKPQPPPVPQQLPIVPAAVARLRDRRTPREIPVPEPEREQPPTTGMYIKRRPRTPRDE
jgi:hypothetical protein